MKTAPQTPRLARRATALLATVPLVVMLSGCSHDTVRQSISAALVEGSPGFSPVEIMGDKEDRMVIRVGNSLPAPHGFAIEGYKVKRVVEPNQTVEVRFRLGRGGTFKIYCHLHPAHQPATLIVR